jgi:hypothetical protein
MVRQSSCSTIFCLWVCQDRVSRPKVNNPRGTIFSPLQRKVVHWKMLGGPSATQHPGRGNRGAMYSTSGSCINQRNCYVTCGVVLMMARGGDTVRCFPLLSSSYEEAAVVCRWSLAPHTPPPPQPHLLCPPRQNFTPS